MALATEVALGTALIFIGEYEEGAARLDVAAQRSAEARDHQELAYLGAGLGLAGRHDAAARVLTHVIDDARAAGALTLSPYALIRLADVQLETGQWPAASAALHEAVEVARETGQPADAGLALGALAWMAGARGSAEDCRVCVEEALQIAGRLGSGSRLDRAGTAEGLLELGLGHPEAAIAYLESACRLQDEQGWWSAGGAAIGGLGRLVEERSRWPGTEEALHRRCWSSSTAGRRQRAGAVPADRRARWLLRAAANPPTTARSVAASRPPVGPDNAQKPGRSTRRTSCCSGCGYGAASPDSPGVPRRRRLADAFDGWCRRRVRGRAHAHRAYRGFRGGSGPADLRGVVTLAYLAGLADAALAQALEHVRSREQFGAPLAALPAVQARLADAALARDGLLLSAWSAADPEAGFPRESLAWAGAACREVTAHVQQVHGGIGFALEGGIHRYYRRAKAVQVWTDALLRELSRPL